MTLDAETAADLMRANPVSIGADATVQEAIAFLAKKGYSAAPVIDAAGRPIGVLSQSDLLIHDRQKVGQSPAKPEYYERADLTTGSGQPSRDVFRAEGVEPTRVRDVMTPIVFSVAPEASACKVVEDMLALMVHRLFVVDSDGVLTGVISALDVLRHLRKEQPEVDTQTQAGRESRSSGPRS
jgi:CBS domain-containing protein